MGNTLQQDIRVRIDTFINGLPQVQALSAGIAKIHSTPTKKIEFGDASQTEQLAQSVDKLAIAVERIDEGSTGRLSRFFTILGGIATVLGHLKGSQEGIGVIKEIAAAAPNLSANITAAGTVISGFFTAAKDKAAAGVSLVKEKVSSLVEDLPNLTKGLGSASGGLLGIGAAAGIAVGSLLLVGGAIALIVGAVVGVPIIVSKLLSLANSAAETGSKFHDLSQQTGVSVELLSSLAPVADDSNGSIDGLAQGIGRFNKLIGEAAKGSKEAIAKLAEFDLKPKEALANTDAALEKVIKRILELPPGTQQAIAMQDAFGKSGAKLLPTLIATGGNIEAVKKRAQELGKYWTGEGAAAADEYGDRIAELQRIIEGFGESIGRTLIPELLRLLRIFGSEMPVAGGIFQTVLGHMASTVRSLTTDIIFLIAAVKTLRDVPGAIAAGVATGSAGVGTGVLAESFKNNLAGLLQIADTPGGGSTRTERPLDFSGGGGGGGGGRNSKPEDTFESVFGFNKASADSALKLLKDSIERQQKTVEESFAKRKIAIGEFYAEQERLQRQALNFEIESTKQSIVEEQKRLAHKIQTIQAKPADELDNAEKAAQVAIATKETETETVALNEKLVILLRDRAELAGTIADNEIEARRALQDQLQSVIDDIDRAKGLGPLVEARQQIQELHRQVEELRLNGEDFAAEMLEQWAEVLGTVGQFYARISQEQRRQEVNEAKINRLREEGSRNVVSQFLAEQQVNAIRKEQLAGAEALLQELIRIANTTTDPAILAQIENQRAAVAALRNEYQTLGQTIKDTFIDSAVDGIQDFFLSLKDVFSGVKSLGDVFRAVALSIIEDISRIIAKMIAMRIVMAILNIAGAAAGGGGGGLPGVSAGNPIVWAASGGEFSAAPGGRLVRLAEAGHDELVVSTDPSIAKRTASLLGRFIKRTGILPTFDGGFSSGAILGNISARIPSLGMGDFVPATPGGQFSAGDTVTNLGGLHLHFPNVRDARSFKVNEQTIYREAGRAIESGIRKARGTRD